jgi:hypothetical protein
VNDTPTTAAGRKHLAYLTKQEMCEHPHGEEVVVCWACAEICAIEREAVAAERARLHERVASIEEPIYDGDTWTTDCEHGWDTAMWRVLRLLECEPAHGPHCDADLRRSGCVCTDAARP